MSRRIKVVGVIFFLFVAPFLASAKTLHLNDLDKIYTGKGSIYYDPLTQLLSNDFNGDGYSDLILPGGLGYGDANTNTINKQYTVENTDYKVLRWWNDDSLKKSIKNAFPVQVLADLNGDGFDDAFNIEGYVFFGGVDKAGVHVGNVRDVLFRHIEGDDAESTIFNGVGDFNGDGFDDVIITFDENETYIYYGRENVPSVVTFPEDADVRFVDRVLERLEVLGDINNDGKDDILLHHRHSTQDSLFKAYILYGSDNIRKKVRNLHDISETIIIDEGEYEETTFSAAGDVNGDGFDDFLMGKPDRDRTEIEDAGKIYLFYGQKKKRSTLEINDADVIFKGRNKKDRAGGVMQGVGDLNGDGYDDMVLGTLKTRKGKTGTMQKVKNKVFIVYGQSNFRNRNVLTKKEYHRIKFKSHLRRYESEPYYSVVPAGDINNDGKFEFLLWNMSYKNQLSLITKKSF